MWSSQSFRIASWKVTADRLITGGAGVLPCAGRTPEIAITASANATATISRPTGIDHLRRVTNCVPFYMTPSRAADRGTRSHAGASESLGEVATPTCTPCVSPGATIGRFLAAGDRVLEPARHLL
jgi:hypothetical protein